MGNLRPLIPDYVPDARNEAGRRRVLRPITDMLVATVTGYLNEAAAHVRDLDQTQRARIDQAVDNWNRARTAEARGIQRQSRHWTGGDRHQDVELAPAAANDRIGGDE